MLSEGPGCSITLAKNKDSMGFHKNKSLSIKTFLRAYTKGNEYLIKSPLLSPFPLSLSGQRDAHAAHSSSTMVAGNPSKAFIRFDKRGTPDP